VDPRELNALLAPYPSEEMTSWHVSTRVGNVKNNDASLVEPISTRRWHRGRERRRPFLIRRRTVGTWIRAWICEAPHEAVRGIVS